MDDEEKIRAARQKAKGAEARGPGDPWKDRQPPARRESKDADPWKSKPSLERKPAGKDPWRDSGPPGSTLAPWDLEDTPRTAVEKVKSDPWKKESAAPVVAPWEVESPKAAAPKPVKSDPWKTNEPKAAPVKAPWEPQTPVIAPWEKEKAAMEAKAPWDREGSSVRIEKTPPAPAPSLPAQAPWEKNLAKLGAVSSPRPWASKPAAQPTRKAPEPDGFGDNFADITEAEEFGVSRNDVQAAKLAPWNKSKSPDRGTSPVRNVEIIRFVLSLFVAIVIVCLFVHLSTDPRPSGLRTFLHTKEIRTVYPLCSFSRLPALPSRGVCQIVRMSLVL